MTEGKPPEFPGNIINFTPTRKRGRPPTTAKGRAKKIEGRIPVPVVPTGDVNISELIVTAQTDPTSRAYAAAVLRSRMYSFEEIAHLLGYANPTTARSAVVGHVLSLDKGNDLETLRYALIGALEANARRSITLAAADAFQDADGNVYQNSERIAWHREARQDLEALARISGAQAAAQVKLLTPESAELDELVRQLELAAGRKLVEPDVMVLDEVIVEDESDAG